MTKNKRKWSFAAFAAALVLSLSGAVAIHTAPPRAHAAEPEVTLFAAGDGTTYTVTDTRLPAKAGGVSVSDQLSPWKGSFYANSQWINLGGIVPSAEGAHFDKTAVQGGATSGDALGAKIGSWGITGQREIRFAESVDVALVDSLTFRVFASISETSPFGGYNAQTGQFAQSAGTSGIWLYGLGATGERGEGYRVDPFLSQGEWTNITLSGADLARLADASGNISGFTLGAAFISGIYDTNANANEGAADDKSAIVFFDTVTAKNVYSAGSAGLAAGIYTGEKNLATDRVTSADGDYTGRPRSLTMVGGKTAMTDNDTGNGVVVYQYHDWGNLASIDAGESAYLADAKSGSDDGKAFATRIGNWGFVEQDQILFSDAYALADVESVTFRVWLHIKGDGPFTGGLNAGIWLYGADATGAADQGVQIDPYTAQDEWTDITVSGANLSKIADKNGKISGFTLGAGMVGGVGYDKGNPDGGLYWDKGASLFIDYVDVKKKTEGEGYRTVEVADGSSPVVSNFGAYATAFDDAGKLHVLTFSGRETYDLSSFARAYRVTFYNQIGGAVIGSAVIPAGGTTEDVSVNAPEGYRLRYWTDENGEVFDGAVNRTLSLYGVWEADIDADKLLSGGGDFTLGNVAENKLTALEGKTDMAPWVKNIQPTVAATENWKDIRLSSAGAPAGAVAGSDDGNALAIFLNGWGFTFSGSLLFDRPVRAADIDALTLRMYAHFSDSATYGLKGGEWYLGNIGLYFYATDATGAAGEGVLIPTDIPQNGWTDLVLTGADLAKLANADGEIDGLVFAGGMISDKPEVFYGWKGAGFNTGSAYLLLDYVTVNREATVTYMDGADVLREDSVLTGAKADYIPEKAGKVFVGWHRDGAEGELFDAGKPVAEDVVLYAEWKDAGSLSGKEGVYLRDGKTVMVFDDGEIRTDEDFGKIYWTAFASDGNLYIMTETGRVVIALDSPADGMLVRYFGSDGELFERMYVLRGESAPALEISCGTADFVYWSETENGGEYAFGALDGDVDLYAVWRYRLENDLLTDAKTGYSVGGETRFTQVAGATSLNGGTVTDASVNPIDSVDVSAYPGSADGRAFRQYFFNWGFTYGLPVLFDEPVSSEGLEGLVFRMYVHLSPKSPYGAFLHGGKGARIFGVSSDGSDAGVLVPVDIRQDEWVDFVLTKEQVRMLADGDGMIRGFAFGSGFIADSEDMENGYLYNYTESVKPFILVDYVAAAPARTVTYSDGSAVLGSETVASGASISGTFVPEKAGKVFAGWTLFGQPFAYDEEIRQDVTLIAEWKDAKTLADVNGLYTKDGEQPVMIFDDGELRLPGAGEILAWGVSSENVLYAAGRDGVTEIGLGEYQKPECVIVTFDGGTGDVVRTLAPKGGKVFAPAIDRPGYVFAGWKTEGGEAFDAENDSVTADTALVAAWNYDLADAEEYYGVYYADGVTIELAADGLAKVSSGGGVTSFSYAILTSSEIVIENYASGTVYGTHLVLDGVNYVKLGTVIVSFDAGEGVTAPAAQTLSGTYKAQKPADPVREGYTFLGWTLPDGRDFDFDSVVASSVTLEAKWQKNAAEPDGGDSSSEEDKGCAKGCGTVAFGSGAGGTGGTIVLVTGLSALLVALLRKRKCQ